MPLILFIWYSTHSVAFDYLNQPANGIHRTAAIAVGAVSGYIIAIRRGFFRRLLYTSIGGLGVASICYPKEAEKYWQQSLNETKTYATILYNFAYGGMHFFIRSIGSVDKVFCGVAVFKFLLYRL